ncbi:hypothetical protein ACU4GD_02230 [Cupriavidus basilensis]
MVFIEASLSATPYPGGLRADGRQSKENIVSETVLILGANGRLGRTLVDAFAAAGWEACGGAGTPPAGRPRCAARRAQPCRRRGRHRAVERRRARRQRGGGERAEPRLHGMGAARRSARAQRNGYGAGTGRSAALPRQRVYNYGEAMPPLLRPDTAERLQRAQGPDPLPYRSGHAQARPGAAQRGHPCRRFLWRAGARRMDGPGDRQIARSRQGRLPGPARPRARLGLPADLAQAFVAVAQRQADLRGHAVLHFAGHTLTGEQLVSALAEASGMQQAPRVGGMPWWLIRAGGAVVPMWRELAEMAYLVEGAARRSTAPRCKALVGELPRTPLQCSALRESLGELGLRVAA